MLLNASLPLYNKGGGRFGSAALTLLQDKNYQEGLLPGKGGMASYSYELSLGAPHTLVSGLQLGYFTGALIGLWNKAGRSGSFGSSRQILMI